MFKTILCLLVLLGINFYIPVCNAKDSEPVLSTQGIELDNNIEKSKPATEQKNEQKQIKNRSKKYIKYKKNLKKQDFKRTQKQQELEYLEKRLEAKKSKLKSLTSDQQKGEVE